MKLQDLFQEIQNREDSNVSGETITEDEIVEIEQSLGVKLPKSYRLFLREFGPGGEFIFARMRSFDDSEQIEEFWNYWGDMLGENCRSEYFPIGDDYSGNYYCFELAKGSEDVCPIVLIDDALEDDPSDLVRFASLEELISCALKGESIFAE